jgi:hypothetical protein
MGRLGIKSFVLAKGACRDAQANGIEPLSVAHAVWPAASQLATNPVPRRIIHSLVYLDCACIRCDAMRCDAARTHPTFPSTPEGAGEAAACLSAHSAP